MVPPNEPAGSFVEIEHFDDQVRNDLIQQIEAGPASLQAAVNGLTEEELDTPYKNWTIRQITHHLADSHVHSYIRFKWAMNEESPTIKAYDESVWAVSDDCKSGSIEPALAMFNGIHQKWTQLLNTMKPEDFERTFLHPETESEVRLWSALNYYPWHIRHHTGQILWLRKHRLRNSTSSAD